MPNTPSAPDPPSGPACPVCGAPLPPEAPHGLCPRCLLAGVANVTDPGEPAAPLPAALAIDEIAPHFPQLEIQQCLGRGGMGVVYQARQKSLNRLVALKLLAPERVHDSRFAERFQREAHALAALNHPHIVTVHDFGQAGPFFYLLMEFVDGVNLRQAMRAGRFTPEQALAIVPPVCEALQYAHDHGIVHRDIKPENLLLDKEGRVKIADFGIAKILGSEDPTIGAEQTQPAGTPQYMAPEQQAHRTSDHRADIYSLGVVLYEMLTGELPGQRILAPSTKVQIDVRLDEVVLRALAASPELRYQTAAEFRTQVETISVPAPSGPTTPEPAGSTAPAPAEKRFSTLAVIGAVWAFFAFPAFFAYFGVRVESTVQGQTHHGPAWWQILLMVTLLPTGLTSPFGATLLGWMAVTRIRQSAGRITGLGLAVFDGLLFPLLALLPAVGYVLFNLGKGFLGWTGDFQNEANGQLAAITCLVWAGLSIAIVRWVWSEVTNSTAPSRSIGPKFAWAVAIVLGILILSWATLPLFRERAARQAELRARRSAPRTEQISSDAGTVFIVHDTMTPHYVFYYHGNFNGESRATSNMKSNVWVDDDSIRLPNGRSFGFVRESHDDLHLRINGAEYDLRSGRVFVLLSEGTVQQFPLSPALSEARNVNAVRHLIQMASPLDSAAPLPAESQNP